MNKITIRFSEIEAQKIAASAAKMGLTPTAYAKHCITQTPPPAAEIPAELVEILRQILTHNKAIGTYCDCIARGQTGAEIADKIKEHFYPNQAKGGAKNG